VARPNTPKNRKKTPHHLLGKDSEGVRIEQRLERGCLEPEGYERLLSWWEKNGCLNRLPINKIAVESWRKSFVRSLKDYVKRYEWKVLLEKGSRRYDRSQRESIRHWLDQG